MDLIEDMLNQTRTAYLATCSSSVDCYLYDFRRSFYCIQGKHWNSGVSPLPSNSAHFSPKHWNGGVVNVHHGLLV
jgi:hypothetical protein